MLTAQVKTNSAPTATGNSSQVQIGSTPQARMKTKTMTRLRQKLKAPVSTVASGITSRGNWVLRTIPSWATTEVTAFVRRFLEEGEEDDPEQQQDRVVVEFAADFEDLGEDEEQDSEQHQRSDQRPEVAEHGAEVGALELGHRDQPEQVEEAARAAAERGGAVTSRSGRGSRCGGAHRALPLSTVASTSCGRRDDPAGAGSPPKTTKSIALWT